jgi:hypothetical protein
VAAIAAAEAMLTIVPWPLVQRVVSARPHHRAVFKLRVSAGDLWPITCAAMHGGFRRQGSIDVPTAARSLRPG